MVRTITALIIIVVLVLIIGAVALFLQRNPGIPNTGAGASANYTNAAYDYSLSIPAPLSAREMLPEFVEIGSGSGKDFAPAVDVAVVHAGLTEPLPSYQDFVNLSASLACGLYAGRASACATVASSTPFTAASGLHGQELFFGSGAPSPIYAFDISSNVTNGKYGVLLVYSPSAPGDSALVQELADSLQINRK